MPLIVDYFDTRCPAGRHYSHPGLTCQHIGSRPWDPITGYRAEAEVDADPPRFTGILANGAQRVAIDLADALADAADGRDVYWVGYNTVARRLLRTTTAMRDVPAALRGPRWQPTA